MRKSRNELEGSTNRSIAYVTAAADTAALIAWALFVRSGTMREQRSCLEAHRSISSHTRKDLPQYIAVALDFLSRAGASRYVLLVFMAI